MALKSMPEAAAAPLSRTLTVTKPAWGTKTVTCLASTGPKSTKQLVDSPGLSDRLLWLSLTLFSTPVVANHTRLVGRSSRRTPPAAG